jgi:hypothetical protein
MNRRDFMSTVVVGTTAMRISRLLPPPVATGETGIATPSWLTEEPLIIVGNWDSMPIFQVRRGGQPVWYEEDYREESSPATVKKLSDLGVTLAVIHFYKGFGLQAEREHVEVAKRLAALLHENGIKVGLYVGSTIAYETFLVEKPEAEEWFAPDYLGKPVIYFDQTFRKRVYFMHPGYLDYMKRVVRMGVEELKADEIDFDNTSLQAEPAIFQHPLAIKHFREFLTAQYRPEELKERFGFSNMRYVVPPKVDFPLSAINDPLFQEWAGFRCRQLNRYYAEMYATIRGANPNTAVGTNPHSGISGRNTIWEQGVHYPTLLPNMDIVWTEEGDYAAMTQDGILVSKIRTYKMATRLNKRVLTYTAGSEGGGKVAMAESMAFNRQTLGQVGSVLEAAEIPQDQRRYVDFFHQQFRYFRGVESIADVAVLYSYASMGFNNDGPAVSFMLFTQALIQAKVPFDIIFDEHLKDLANYRVLVLADQECLDDDQMELMRKYVREGGGLVATGLTSLYTPWRLRRRDFGLRDLFGTEAPKVKGNRARELDIPDIAAVQTRLGQGRVSYLPREKPAIEKPAAARMTSSYWKLPLNWKELVEQVQWAAGGKFTLEVEAPDTLAVVAEQQKQEESNRRLVHLLNYASPAGPGVYNVRVEIALPPGKAVRQARLLTPDGESETTVPCDVANDRARFTVPHLDTYTIAVLELESP